MKPIANVVATLMGWTAVFGVVFIFWGEPDLWDKWHEKAMASAECKQ